MVDITSRARSTVAALAVAVASHASADTTVIPNLLFTVGSGSNTYTYAAAGAGNAWANGNSTFGFAGSTNSLADGPSGFSFAWNLLVNPDPFIIGNIVVTNTSTTTQSLFVQITLPTNLAMPQTLVGGSITGTLTDLNGDGATLSSIGSNSIYTALTDLGFGTQALAGGLLSSTSVSTGPFLSASIGPASFGDPIPSQPHGAVNENITVQFQFSLSAGDSASFTSIFVVEPVPAPGAMALLGLAGLAAGRRRRR